MALASPRWWGDPGDEALREAAKPLTCADEADGRTLLGYLHVKFHPGCWQRCRGHPTWLDHWESTLAQDEGRTTATLHTLMHQLETRLLWQRDVFDQLAPLHARIHGDLGQPNGSNPSQD